MFAIDGEEAIILDALPETADQDEVLAIIEEVHQENVAAVMFQGDLGYTLASTAWTMDREARPRSGLPDEYGYA